MDAAWVWKLPIHPRIQLFVWKLLWDCIPTCTNLSSKGLHILASCPLCGLEEETTDHVLFACPRVRMIWQRVGYVHRIDSRGSLCTGFLQNLRQSSRQQISLWTATAYHIWLSRNRFIFSSEPTSSFSIVRRARTMADDFSLLHIAPEFGNSGHWGSPATTVADRHTVFISWEPPPPGFAKLNFDGSVRGRSAGSAFVIRGPGGDLLAAGGFGSLDSAVPLAELYAAWAGILHAIRTLRVLHLIIEGDSLTVIRWMRNDCGYLGPSNPIIRNIWAILGEAVSVQIRHVYREANTAADWVAEAVAHHGGHWGWTQGDLCPVVLKQILYSDRLGLTRTRVV